MNILLKGIKFSSSALGIFPALLALGLVLSCAGSAEQEMTPADYVNTLTGTLSKYSLSTGNTYPAVACPWGMNFWTPQTGEMGNGWTYTYTADKIRGFKQTHQPSPWMNDYGQFSIMPETGSPVTDEARRGSWFSHKAETAKPYLYSVYLADYDVLAEMTATERAAKFRFTYPESEMSWLVVDAFDSGSSVSVDKEAGVICGYTTKNSGGVPEGFKNWFVLKTDKKIEYVEGGCPEECDHAVLAVGFKTQRGEQVIFDVASSFISPEQAVLNLDELSGNDFDGLAAQNKARWNDVLGRISVEDGDVDKLRTFYSCLYRSVLFPRDISEIDADGKIVHYDFHNGGVKEGYYFTDTGFWDTFRSLFPLLNLVYPDMSEKMQRGLVNCWDESGYLPEWASPGHRDCMVGNNSASVVADAWMTGRRGYDVEALWRAVVNDANVSHPLLSSVGRLGYEYYNQLGYVPYDAGIRENVARTLEYAYDDWCIWTLGKALGKPEAEIDVYRQRALNYRNVFDKSVGWMRGRCLDGAFQSPFNPFKWGDAFTEGNSIHYTWSVFHDIAGLAELMGGEEQMAQKLDSVFIFPPEFDASYYGSVIHEITEMQIMNYGNYAHGNQPVQHMLYLYDWVRQPWKTQFRVRDVMDKFYNAGPDGYCGDEDNGQTSAWYVFSALGFYPVCPASGQYALGSPLFKKATVSLPNGRSIVISADNNGPGTPYIRRMKIDGKEWSHNWISYDQLCEGARIDYIMASEPDYSRGVADGDAPYSMSKE